MSTKIAIFAFKGDALCFIHVLLNAIDLSNKGNDVRIILEGESTKLIANMSDPSHFLHKLYLTAKEMHLIDAVCRACATKMDTITIAQSENLPVAGEMSGHPAMSFYLEKGYEIISM